MKFKRIFLIFLSLFLSSNSFAQQFENKFDTKNHNKSKGVWLTVKYPTGWVANEGERPNIVQMFSGKNDGKDYQLLLQIRDMGSDIEDECSKTNETQWNETFSNAATNTFATNSKKIKVEGKTAFLSDMSISTQRLEYKFSFASKQMAVCHKKNLIILSCSNSLIGEKMLEAKSNIEKVSGFCSQFFNTFVLAEKY